MTPEQRELIQRVAKQVEKTQPVWSGALTAMLEENALLRQMIDTVMAIPTMSNDQLAELVANCKTVTESKRADA